MRSRHVWLAAAGIGVLVCSATACAGGERDRVLQFHNRYNEPAGHAVVHGANTFYYNQFNEPVGHDVREHDRVLHYDRLNRLTGTTEIR